MKEKIESAEEFIQNTKQNKDILIRLRSLILSCGLEETIKWNIPVYTCNGKNVVGLASFKSYTGLWFYQGVQLNDSHKMLISAQDKTKSLRQWRFNSPDEINDELIIEYIQEAMVIACLKQ